MRFLASTLCLLLIPAAAFSQIANGTITGTVTDPTGATVAGAAVVVTNTDTGVTTPTVSTPTGAYTAPNLPVGAYSVTVTAAGFKRYVRAGLSIAAAQVLEVNIPLEVGAASESVTITAEASLLKTESGDVAHNITVEQLDDLPVLGIGGVNSGSSGVRNPYNSVVFIPGVSYSPNITMIVNGAPTNTAAYRVEGMDNTNHTVSFALQENQQSADAIQEVAVQTSAYAPEFGQAGGGLFNIIMKSGTNQYHGSGYDYFVNEDLNAAFPFSNDGSGNKVRPRNRRNDFGGTLGGPIRIPKLYNGTNKTFFFFSYEQFREGTGLNFTDTVPVAAYRIGDFSAISPNGGANFNPTLGVPATPLGTDALGRPIFANEIYDPTTRGVAPAGSPFPGQGFANPFQNNQIPLSMISAYAKAVQPLIPNPSNGLYTNNYNGSNLSQRVTPITSLKLDQVVGSKGKLSFYWDLTGTVSLYSTPNGNADGLPDEISGARGTFIHSLTERLNYDYTLTPTLLLHAGVGYSRILFIDTAPYTYHGNTVNCATLSVQGCDIAFNFPTVSSTVSSTGASGIGGMQQMGNALAHTTTRTLRPSSNLNATWIHNSHTFKFGGEVWFQGNITAPPSGVGFNFGSAGGFLQPPANFGATAQPYTVPAGLKGQQMGNFYANFLLGDAIQATQYAPLDARMGKSQWGFFAQDAWKVTPKLTVTYGLRWDLATPNTEQYGRSADLGGNVADPAVGGRLGAPIFQATCNCTFVKTYYYAFGPRVGVAYSINSKTVLRGGWGLIYAPPGDIQQSSSSQLSSSPVGINAFADVTAPGTLPQPAWPNFSPGQTPLPGQITGFGGFTSLDPQAARPPRQNQWDFGVSREISHDFVVEAAYVGNRGVWWGGPLGLLNQVTPAAFAAVGLSPYTNPADDLLLSQPISSPQVIAKVGHLSPYPGYGVGNTLLNALRPYPQFSTITVTGSPTGKTWYDSLQVKGTKRMSHGLQVNGTFTWSRALTLIREDIFNPASSSKGIESTDQPFLFNANILYQTQKWFSNKWAAEVTKDWQLGAFVQYGSGFPLTPPASITTNNLGGSEQFRVSGQPLFLKNLNCGCINPALDQVLNPAAWSSPVAGTFGPSSGTFYSDFRTARHPQENFNFGRNFRIKEKYTLSIRAEFVNIFNRTQVIAPITSNPAGPAVPARGTGFGVINEVFPKNATATSFGNSPFAQLFQGPRTGTLVARFTF